MSRWQFCLADVRSAAMWLTKVANAIESGEPFLERLLVLHTEAAKQGDDILAGQIRVAATSLDANDREAAVAELRAAQRRQAAILEALATEPTDDG